MRSFAAAISPRLPSSKNLRGAAADEPADSGESVDAAADGADSTVCDPLALRLPRLGARRLSRGRRDRYVRRTDRPLDGAEDNARCLARPDGRQAAAGHDVRDADAAWNGIGEPAAALV